MIARPIAPAELGAFLSTPAAYELRSLLAAEVTALVESGHRVADLAFWLEDGLLECYALDDMEAAAGAGGSLLAEVSIGHGAARCLVCGQHNATDPRPWCSRRCRLLLRGEALARFPEVAKAEVVGRAVAWAVSERNARLGWYVPLTRSVAEVLYHRR